MTRSTALRRAAAGLLCAGTLATLSCDSTTKPVQLPPAVLEIISGNAQEGVVGEMLAEPLIARVENENGQPVQGQIVNFVVVSGGGSVFAGSSISNAQGIVQEWWTLGPTVGEQRVEARAVDNETGERLVFATFTALAFAPPTETGTMVKAAGDAQDVPAGTVAPVDPAVRITDPNGAPISGVEVLFQITSGGGSLTDATATTDANGVAAVGSWTVGTQAGPTTLTASTADYPTVTFTGTIVAGAPASIVKHAGDAQAGGAGQALAVDPAVRLTDQYGNPVPGATVTFEVESGGGSVTGATPLSDENGIATVGSWILGAEGPQSLRATATGAGSVVFTATAVPGLRPSTIAAGYLHSCAVVDGASYCWGRNTFREVDGTTTTTWLQPVRGPETNLLDIAAGEHRSCGLRPDGTIWCWGQINGRMQSSSTITPTFTAFDAWATGGCAISTQQQAWCWGRMVGTPSLTALPANFRFLSVDVGLGHACGVVPFVGSTTEGAIFCWGENHSRQLGNSGPSTATPQRVTLTEDAFTQVAAGGEHTCGLTTGGDVVCWGLNNSGQLGAQTVFSRVELDLNNAVAIAAGSAHSCALLATGQVLCWGSDQYGQVGDGNGTASAVWSPTPIAGGATYREISAGHAHTCAIGQDGFAYCWGNGEASGTGQTGLIAEPTRVLPARQP
jgi:hypothetical protein